MKTKQIIALLCLMVLPLSAWADVNPLAIYTKDNVEVSDWADIENVDAPLHVRFEANPSDLEEGVSVEWHFEYTGAKGTYTVKRHEETTEYDFVDSGKTMVTLVLMDGDEEIYSTSISVTISDSFLQMPNAFSPNDDDINDYYQAKDGVKSIVEFHGYIFNRWGQKLYEWTDCYTERAGWDGKYHGSPVKDGVYFCLVEARGADGKVYSIRRDVNLLRNKNESYNSDSGSQDQ